jgi:hypothetical protein
MERQGLVTAYLARLAQLDDADEVTMALNAGEVTALVATLKAHRNLHLEMLLALGNALKLRPAVRKLVISGPGLAEPFSVTMREP